MSAFQEIVTEGKLEVGESSIPVFRLANNRKAFEQQAFYYFLKRKKIKENLGYFLGLSRLRKYLPKSFLERKDIIGKRDDELIPILLTEEVLYILNALINAALQKDLGQTWTIAYENAQLLLLAFANEGISATVDRAIEENPPMSIKRFNEVMKRIIVFTFKN